MANDTPDERTPLLQVDDISSNFVAVHGQSSTESSPTDNENLDTDILSKRPPTPLPLRNLAIVMLLTAMPPVVFEVIFPFINQMILEIGIVNDPERVGFYSGIVESVFSVMSFLAVMPASYLSDRIGRKPIIIVGSLGMAISTTSFGFSKSLLSMIISRCVGGASGSVSVSSKIVLGECTDRSNQGKAFQFLTIAYRVGQIVGLPLGGILAHPERNFPIFRSKFWISYPFALPCFVASGFAIIIVFLTYFVLEETLPSKRRSGSSQPKNSHSNSSSTESVLIQSVESNDVPAPSMKSVLTPPIISLLISNAAMVWASETIFSVFPLYSFTPVPSGGLGLNEAGIGIQLAIRALIHVGMMPFYSTLEQFFGGTVRFYRVVMWIWPIVFGSNVRILLLACQCCPRDILPSLGTSVSIMVTDASPSAKALSTINGLSQMATILPQAIAPAFTTALFAVSIKSGIVGACGGALQCITLRESTSDWRSK
ncbi:hypothetical protein Clacol_000850 [Clathrus columnatus]|uniref:Major facilitator superfamily (MFS) profile domain-containing protein n=1 Tax=Clathrus columnatus TaxID=1419009 RepID=A0AAV5A428_9AGAM|nr:hypothetical protein Clacol_000850 [Clathrus columnatus]